MLTESGIAHALVVSDIMDGGAEMRCQISYAAAS